MRGFCLLFLTLAPAFAQGKFYDNNFNNWFVYSGDHRVHDKWGVHLEGQWRRNEYVTPQQLLLRPAVNFNVTSNVMLTGGYAFVSTHRYGDFPAAAAFPEHRLFEQLIVNNSAKGNALQSRFRLEQRWIGVRAPDTTGDVQDLGWRYQNRFRYQFRFVRDLADPWYIASYDEIFLNVAPLKGAEIFDQNRVFAGGGIRLNRYNRLETGYMLQHVLQRNGQIVELNHIWHIAIYSTLPFGD